MTPSEPQRQRGAQALGVIAALALLAFVIALAARFGWELGGRMLKLNEADARQLGIKLAEGVEFETNLLDTWRGRYRVAVVRANGHGLEAEVVRLEVFRGDNGRKGGT